MSSPARPPSEPEAAAAREPGTPDPAEGPDPDASAPNSALAARLWGLVGVLVLLGSAAYRLGARGVDAMNAGLTPLEWAALVALTAVFVYGEGDRALGRRWVPWVVERLRGLRHEGVTQRALAPLYAIALIGAPRRTLLKAWAGTFAIALAVVVVSRFPPPWRGIVDFAVAAALAWGVLVLLRRAPRALR